MTAVTTPGDDPEHTTDGINYHHASAVLVTVEQADVLEAAKADRHVVIERAGSFEVWAPCTKGHCRTLHSLVATCKSRLDAEHIAQRLDIAVPS